MNCGVVIHTECCKSNCLKAYEKDSSIEEYEVGSSDDEKEEDKEEIDKASVQTCVKFPDEWRP